MNEILFGVGIGLVFGIGALLCFGVLIGLGELLEWFDRKTK